YAFYNTGLTAVTIPSTVTKIENYAFGYTKIESVTIPTKVLWIGMGTFADSLLRYATFEATSYWYYTTSETSWKERTSGSIKLLNSPDIELDVLKQKRYYYYFSNK
ncbi:MAG: leucine-rich repeat domain-containing protein, partial [Treponema sp.]|nr:leucine-rich repeat domain-containing protein [Treponema sp.]